MKVIQPYLFRINQIRAAAYIQTRCASKSQSSKRYSDTLNLPKTKFPLSMKDGIGAKREVDIQKARQRAHFSVCVCHCMCDGKAQWCAPV